MNNLDYVITVKYIAFKVWNILNSKLVLEVGVLEAGKMGKLKDLSDPYKG